MVSLAALGPQGLEHRLTREVIAGWKPELNRSTTCLPLPQAEPPLHLALGDLPRSSSEAQIAGSLVRRFVSGALDEKHKGNNVRYEELKRKFNISPSDPEAPSSTELRHTLVALSQVAWRLDQSCVGLVSSVVAMSWVGRDAAFVKEFTKFLGTLVSAYSTYMDLVIDMLIENLTLLPASAGRLANHKKMSRPQLYDRVHGALQYIVELIPTGAATAMSKAVTAHIPHEKEKRLAHSVYLMNLLRMIKYTPALRQKTLETFMRIAIQIDVQIQGELEELEEEIGIDFATDELPSGENTVDQIHTELIDEEEDWDSEDDEEDEEEDMDPSERLRDTVLKLDTMLSLLFDYYSFFLPESSTETPSPVACSVFDFMLSTFDKTILPTHQSRFTQFLIFWAAQKSPVFMDYFLGMIIGLATDETKPKNIRLSSAAYVSSFTARAKCMDVEKVRAVVSLLCGWLELYLDGKEKLMTAATADLARYGGFYGVVQAVMYIFCFRWRDLKLLDEEDEDEEVNERRRITEGRWIPKLSSVLERAITSPLNPLKICAPDVVEQFADMAQHLNFAYCFSIIERNKRGIIDRAQIPTVDAYFPFDPFQLPWSKKWVDNIYVSWTPIEGTDERDMDVDEEADDDMSSDDESGDEQ